MTFHFIGASFQTDRPCTRAYIPGERVHVRRQGGFDWSWPVIPVDADLVGRRRAIGAEVARWRKRRGLTRQQFAGLCGRSASWVDKVEAGSRGLTQLPMLELVAGVLHVSVDTLTGDARALGSRDAGASACMDAFEIGSIREALQRYEAISSVFVSVQRDQPPDLDRLERSVTDAWVSF